MPLPPITTTVYYIVYVYRTCKRKKSKKSEFKRIISEFKKPQ